MQGVDVMETGGGLKDTCPDDSGNQDIYAWSDFPVPARGPKPKQLKPCSIHILCVCVCVYIYIYIYMVYI